MESSNTASTLSQMIQQMQAERRQKEEEAIENAKPGQRQINYFNSWFISALGEDVYDALVKEGLVIKLDSQDYVPYASLPYLNHEVCIYLEEKYKHWYLNAFLDNTQKGKRDITQPLKESLLLYLEEIQIEVENGLVKYPTIR